MKSSPRFSRYFHPFPFRFFQLFRYYPRGNHCLISSWLAKEWSFCSVFKKSRKTLSVSMLKSQVPLSKLSTKKITYLDVIVHWYPQKIWSHWWNVAQATFVLRSPSVVVASPSSWCPHCRSSWQSEQQSHWCPWRNISWNHRNHGYLAKLTTKVPKVMEVEGEPMSFRISIGWFQFFQPFIFRGVIVTYPLKKSGLLESTIFRLKPVWWEMLNLIPWRVDILELAPPGLFHPNLNLHLLEG